METYSPSTPDLTLPSVLESPMVLGSPNIILESFTHFETAKDLGITTTTLTHVLALACL